MEFFGQVDPGVALGLFAVGACFGSFVTLASHRLPRDGDIVRHRSQCPLCQTPLTAGDLIPLLSWLLSRGRCRYCQAKVSIRYPLIELTLGSLFVLLYTLYGLNAEMVVLALFVTALLTLLVADLETGLIPDEIHLFLLPLGVLYHWLAASAWDQVVAATLTGAASGLLLHYGYYWLRGRHGLGFGDVKFLAVTGLWLGALPPFVAFLFYSGALGVLTGIVWTRISGEERFPFGPALALSLFLLVVFPQSRDFFWDTLTALLRK